MSVRKRASLSRSRASVRLRTVMSDTTMPAPSTRLPLADDRIG